MSTEETKTQQGDSSQPVYTPKHLFSIGKMITEALSQEGYCSHGEQRETCSICMIRAFDDSIEGELRRALDKCLQVLRKGVEPRMMDQWPALKQCLPEAIKAAQIALSLED